MVNEVESILNEIRERVRSDAEQANAPLTLVASADGGEQMISPSQNGRAEGEIENSEALNRLSAHLTTTGRSWDRLPPLYSNRRGSAARIELWIKGRLKSMSRWFIWEQVNFNSAVHHALSETLHALSAQRQELAGMRAELLRDSEAWRDKLAGTDQELSGLRAGIESLTAEIKKRDANQEVRTANLEARSAANEARTATIEARTAAIAAQASERAAALAQKIDEARAEITPRLAELARELRESDQELREEQRVCFKQLSLEASETAVSEDRGRRVIEARLQELETALSNGKK